MKNTQASIIGNQFGRLTVIAIGWKANNRAWKYWCECSCGELLGVTKGNLLSGDIKSCGCFNREMSKERRTTHGLSRDGNGKRTHLFNIWCGMRQRCGYKVQLLGRFKSYKNISVCKEWEDYKNFHRWATMNGYNETLCIDRINTRGDYTPDNCRWATALINSRNTITSKKWVVFGICFDSAKQAAHTFKVSHNTIMRWCGVIGNHGKNATAKDGCYAYNIY